MTDHIPTPDPLIPLYEAHIEHISREITTLRRDARAAAEIILDLAGAMTLNDLDKYGQPLSLAAVMLIGVRNALAYKIDNGYILTPEETTIADSLGITRARCASFQTV